MHCMPANVPNWSPEVNAVSFPVYQIDRLTKRYPSQSVPANQDINLQIDQGEKK